MPQELGFLKHLRAARVPLAEYEFPAAKVANVQSQLERLVAKNYYLHAAAKEAYRGYVLAYNSHALKDAFDVHTLDLGAIAKSLGMAAPPRVNLGLESKTANVRAAARRGGGGGGGDSAAPHKKRMRTGHAFSADNPYGRRAEGDTRQVVRG
jgi:ATP-dependent RNA helicase DDX18/HAS1